MPKNRICGTLETMETRQWQERYFSLNAYARQCFGKKLYKLALNGGRTCPNRDGTLGTRGCLFCTGAAEFAQKGETVAQAIAAAKKRVAHKAKQAGYIAYFQSFTNTYAPVGELEPMFFEAISQEGVEVLSIATRPDCLEPEKIALLRRLREKKPVWVELGLQTAREDVASYLRRGYANEVFVHAVRQLCDAGIGVIAHIILGLPGEYATDVIRSTQFAYDCGARGVKFHLLHVLRGTDLEREYEKGNVRTLTKEQYIDMLCAVILHTPADMVVHRLTGDGDKRLLLAPLWSGNKKEVLNSIGRAFVARGVLQGGAL